MVSCLRRPPSGASTCRAACVVEARALCVSAHVSALCVVCGVCACVLCLCCVRVCVFARAERMRASVVYVVGLKMEDDGQRRAAVGDDG